MRKEQFCPAQNILITPQRTTEQPYEKVNSQLFTEKYSNMSFVQNFRLIKENIGEQLKQIAINTARNRKIALFIANEDAHFYEKEKIEKVNSLQERMELMKKNKLHF